MTDKSKKQERALVKLFKKLGIRSSFWPKRKQIKIGGKDVEVDGIAIYKNFTFLLGTTLQNEKKSKTNSKKFFKQAELICNNPEKLKEYLNVIGIKKKMIRPESIIFKKLFWSPNLNEKYIKDKNKISGDEKYWNDDIFNYFKNLATCIGEYGKYELLGSFDIKPIQIIGENLKITEENYSKAICLDKKRNYSIYICKINPSFLVKVIYVLRKDGWTAASFQRVLSNTKLKDIAEHLGREKGKFIFFPTNIVLAFSKSQSKFTGKKSNYGTLYFPKEFNSVAVIDGQHRLYSLIKLDIKKRKKIKAFAYIIVFRAGLTEKEAIKQQAKVFVDINEKQTPVSKEVIYPIAWNILERRDVESFCSELILNLEKRGILKDKIKLQHYQKNRISIVSIVRYGLKRIINFGTKKKGIIYTLCDKRVQTAIERNKFKAYLDINFNLLNIYFREVFNHFSKVSRKKETPKELILSAQKNLILPKKLMQSTIIIGFIRSLEDILKQHQATFKKSIKKKDYKKISAILKSYLNIVPKRMITRKKYISSKGWSYLKEDLYKLYKDNGLL